MLVLISKFNFKFLVFIRLSLCAAERPHAFITTGDKLSQIKLFAKKCRCSIVVSASHCRSADLGSNPGGAENPAKCFTDSGILLFIV